MRLHYVFVRPEWKERGVVESVSVGLGLGLLVLHKQRTKVKFTEAGGRSYKFRSRSVGHMAKKKRQKGHNKPNVWTGKGRREILRPMNIKPLKTRPSATGKMRARFLNLSNALGTHPKKGSDGKVREKNFRRFPDYRAEMEKLLRKDEQIVARVMTKHVGQFFNRKGRKKVTRV